MQSGRQCWEGGRGERQRERERESVARRTKGEGGRIGQGSEGGGVGAAEGASGRGCERKGQEAR